MSPVNWKVVTMSLGLHCAVSFVLCVAYGLIVSPALHASQLLEMVAPRVSLAESRERRARARGEFLWGVYLGVVFTPIYNFVLKGFGRVEYQ
jgi:hypothetical protein